MLDLSSGRLEEAIGHAEKAVECVDARLAELREAQNRANGLDKEEGGGQAEGAAEEKADGATADAEANDQADGQTEAKEKSEKGKGKQKPQSLLPEDDLQNLTAAQLAAEVRELEGLRGELGMKVRICFIVRF